LTKTIINTVRFTENWPLKNLFFEMASSLAIVKCHLKKWYVLKVDILKFSVTFSDFLYLLPFKRTAYLCKKDTFCSRNQFFVCVARIIKLFSDFWSSTSEDNFTNFNFELRVISSQVMELWTATTFEHFVLTWFHWNCVEFRLKYNVKNMVTVQSCIT
jgi:hypothetical protein